MTKEQAQQAVAELIAAVYPANMHQIIMEGFAKAPNANDPVYWENIRMGLSQQASAAPKGVKKETGDRLVETGSDGVTIPSGPTSIGEEAFGNASVHKTSGSVVIEGKDTKDFAVSPSKDGKSVVVTGYNVQRWKDHVQIPSLVNGKPVSGIAAKAFYNKGAQNLTIPDSITFIGDEAFTKSKLASINIPAGVTSIGKRAFAECSDLAAIVIPDSVTSIADSAFEGCRRLVSVSLGKGITSIGTKAFMGCELSKGIIIPDSVKSIGEEAFFRSKLSSVTIGKGVTDIGNEAFARCNLSSISFSGSVKNIGEEAFADNETAEGDFMVIYSDDAKSIIITQYKGKGKALQLPSKLRGLPVTDIQWRAFNNDITSAVIPDNVSLNSNWTGVTNPSIIRTITIGNNVTIDGNKFDRINAEKIKDFSKGPKFIPLDKLYEKNGRKAGTFTLGKEQWDFKPR